FKLVHPRMAHAIHEKRFRAFERLYRARKLLHECIETCRRDFGARMTGCFRNYDGVLEDVDDVIGIPNLNVNEASLVLRATLATGFRTDIFFQQLGRTYPQIADAIVRDGLGNSRASHIRRNAVLALASLSASHRDQYLLTLALELALKQQETVRRTA